MGAFPYVLCLMASVCFLTVSSMEASRNATQRRASTQTTSYSQHQASGNRNQAVRAKFGAPEDRVVPPTWVIPNGEAQRRSTGRQRVASPQPTPRTSATSFFDDEEPQQRHSADSPMHRSAPLPAAARNRPKTSRPVAAPVVEAANQPTGSFIPSVRVNPDAPKNRRRQQSQQQHHQLRQRIKSRPQFAHPSPTTVISPSQVETETNAQERLAYDPYLVQPKAKEVPRVKLDDYDYYDAEEVAKVRSPSMTFDALKPVDQDDDEIEPKSFFQDPSANQPEMVDQMDEPERRPFPEEDAPVAPDSFLDAHHIGHADDSATRPVVDPVDAVSFFKVQPKEEDDGTSDDDEDHVRFQAPQLRRPQQFRRPQGPVRTPHRRPSFDRPDHESESDDSVDDEPLFRRPPVQDFEQPQEPEHSVGDDSLFRRPQGQNFEQLQEPEHSVGDEPLFRRPPGQNFQQPQQSTFGNQEEPQFDSAQGPEDQDLDIPKFSRPNEQPTFSRPDAELTFGNDDDIRVEQEKTEQTFDGLNDNRFQGEPDEVDFGVEKRPVVQQEPNFHSSDEGHETERPTFHHRPQEGFRQPNLHDRPFGHSETELPENGPSIDERPVLTPTRPSRVRGPPRRPEVNHEPQFDSFSPLKNKQPQRVRGTRPTRLPVREPVSEPELFGNFGSLFDEPEEVSQAERPVSVHKFQRPSGIRDQSNHQASFSPFNDGHEHQQFNERPTNPPRKRPFQGTRPFAGRPQFNRDPLAFQRPEETLEPVEEVVRPASNGNRVRPKPSWPKIRPETSDRPSGTKAPGRTRPFISKTPPTQFNRLPNNPDVLPPLEEDVSVVATFATSKPSSGQRLRRPAQPGQPAPHPSQLVPDGARDEADTESARPVSKRPLLNLAGALNTVKNYMGIPVTPSTSKRAKPQILSTPPRQRKPETVSPTQATEPQIDSFFKTPDFGSFQRSTDIQPVVIDAPEHRGIPDDEPVFERPTSASPPKVSQSVATTSTTTTTSRTTTSSSTTEAAKPSSTLFPPFAKRIKSSSKPQSTRIQQYKQRIEAMKERARLQTQAPPVTKKEDEPVVPALETVKPTSSSEAPVRSRSKFIQRPTKRFEVLKTIEEDQEKLEMVETREKPVVEPTRRTRPTPSFASRRRVDRRTTTPVADSDLLTTTERWRPTSRNSVRRTSTQASPVSEQTLSPQMADEVSDAVPVQPNWNPQEEVKDIEADKREEPEAVVRDLSPEPETNAEPQNESGDDNVSELIDEQSNIRMDEKEDEQEDEPRIEFVGVMGDLARADGFDSISDDNVGDNVGRVFETHLLRPEVRSEEPVDSPATSASFPLSYFTMATHDPILPIEALLTLSPRDNGKTM